MLPVSSPRTTRTRSGLIFPYAFFMSTGSRSLLSLGLGSSTHSAWTQERSMWDLGCIVASVAFFAVAILYAAGCERLATKVAKP